MSEPAPPGLPNDAPVRSAAALTPEAIANILAEFHAWLTAEAQRPPTEATRPPSEEPIDLHTLLAQFIALRHEVNLQTRATRAQQEQNAETLRQLASALDAAADRSDAAPHAEGDDGTRALLKALLDVHDALTVGSREVLRVQDAIALHLAQIAELTQPYPVDAGLLQRAASPSFWQRWSGGGTAAHRDALAAVQAHEEQAARQVRERLERLRQMTASLATGYTMSLQRVERALEQQGLEAMAVVGTPFDPERMEVLEVVADSDRPSGEVVGEVRRGYVWQGRVFRYAQVRVAKS
jgi:molecular chaperone GrpE